MRTRFKTNGLHFALVLYLIVTLSVWLIGGVIIQQLRGGEGVIEMMLSMTRLYATLFLAYALPIVFATIGFIVGLNICASWTRSIRSYIISICIGIGYGILGAAFLYAFFNWIYPII